MFAPWVLLALLLALPSTLYLGTITASNYHVMAASVYSLKVNRFSTTGVPLNSLLVLTLSAYFQVSSPSCSSTDFGSSNITCSFLASKLTVSGLFSQSSYLNLNTFTLAVGGVTNPQAANDYIPVSLLQITSGGTTVEEASSSQTVTITPLDALCTSTLSGELAFARGVTTISYVSSYIVGQTNSSYTLNIQISNYYPTDTTQTMILPTFTPTFETYQNLGVNSIYSLNYSTQVAISMLMPPSTQPLPNFIALSSYSSSGLVETCSLSLTGVKPNVFKALTLTQGTVQTQTSVQFVMKLSTPLMNTDQIQLIFASGFGLGSVTATSLPVNAYSFPLSRNNLQLTLTAALAVPLYTNDQVYFTVGNITLPFTTASSTVLVSILTSDGYYRINQTYSYVCLAGTLAAQVNCLNRQVGTSTSCLFSLTTASSLASDAGVKITLPNQFPVTDQQLSCSVNGNALLTATNCSYSSGTNSILISPLSPTNAVVPPLNFTLNVSLVMSTSVGTFTVSLSTLSAGVGVDAGSSTISAVTRTLSSSEFSLACSSSTTFSAASYLFSFNLPFETGYAYTLVIYIPVSVQDGLSPSCNATLVSYSNFTLELSSYLPAGSAIQVTNLLTPTSTAPTPVTISIAYNGQTFFNTSTSITMTLLKAFQTLTLTQSNQVVYSPFTATIALTSLEVGDLITLESTAGTYFFSQNQTNCTTSVVNCSSNPLKVVSTAAAPAPTDFSVQMVNLAYEGTSTLTVTLQNSLLYGKRKGTVSVIASVPNVISVSGTYNSAAYLQEASSYYFQLGFSTPNATQLYLSYNGFSSVTAACQLNCALASTLTSGFIFALTSTSARIVVNATNPSAFTTSTIFSFTTMDSSGNRKDYGQFEPTAPCLSPCRSCQDNNLSYCLTCYSWASLKYHLSNNCLALCPSGYYSQIYNNLYSCIACSTGCTDCSSAGCLACAPNYFIYAAACFTSCPSGTLTITGNNSCSPCLSPCATCTPTLSSCTSCLANYLLLNSTCYSSCPDGYYAPSLATHCEPCPSTCLTCNAAGCLSCQPSDYLYRGSCYSVCPVGSFPGGSSCTACLSSCFSCSSLVVCSSCSAGYYLASNSTCSTFCPSGYFPSGSVCAQCVSPCLTCTAAGCLSCSDATLYLEGQQCVSSCSSPKHPNNNTMLCQNCISPCSDCSWSDTCLACITGYSLLGTACLSTCPTGFYSNGATCVNCPLLCSTCAWVNQQVACNTCLNSSLIFSYDCVAQCPNSTTLSGLYCLSSDCSALSNCLVCSGFRCLQCQNLYQITADYSCQKKASSSEVLQALAQIPVPFPFLIAIVALVIVAFLLKYHFQKMSAPLFLYALAGVPEQLSLVLWATLAMLWNSNVVEPLPLPSSPHATVLILIVYLLLNVLELVLWRRRVVPDRQHRLWEKQDNRCSSNLLAFFSLLLSYRLDVLRFSRAGHSSSLSARVSSAEVFRHYRVLAGLGMVVNAGMVLVSVYLFSIQSQQNYLLFSCLEVAIIGVLMIVLAIVMLCIPDQQILEDRAEYKYGQDQDQLEGPSLQEALGVQEEEYHSQAEVHSSSAVLAKEAPSVDLSSQQPQELLSFGEGAELDSEGEGTVVAARMKAPETSNPLGLVRGMEEESAGSESHILVDESELYRAAIVALGQQFKLKESQGAPLFSRSPGVISKQRVQQLPEASSEEPSFLGDYEEYTLEQQHRGWKKKGQTELQEGLGLPEQSLEIDQDIIQARGVIERDMAQQAEQHQKQALRQQQQALRQQQQALRQQEQALQHQRQQALQHQQQQQQQALRHQQEQQALQQQQQQALRHQLQRAAEERDQEVKKREREARAEIERIAHLHRLLNTIDQQQSALTELNNQIEQQEAHLQKQEQERSREKRERALMSVEDQLSRATPLFQIMNIRTAKGRFPKIRKNSGETPLAVNTHFKYSADQDDHFLAEVSPRKIKIEPKPSPSQYQLSHIYCEEGVEIEQHDDEFWEEEEQEIVFESDQTVMMADKKVDKPKSILRRQNLNPPPQIEQHTEEYDPEEEKTQTLPKEKEAIPTKSLEKNEEQRISLQECNQAYLQEEVVTKILQENEERKAASKEEVVQEAPKEEANQEIRKEESSKVVPEEMAHQAVRESRNLEVVGGQAEEERQQPFLSSSEERSIRSDYSHWPIEPELEERILSVEKKAQLYLEAPKKSLAQLHPSEGIQEEEISEQTVGEIVFEQSEKMVPVEELMRVQLPKKFKDHRINRRVIDLAP